MISPAHIASPPINLDQPGTYLHWSIFEVSVANLVVIAVMVVLFGAALLLPFPTAAPTRRSSAAAGCPRRSRPGPVIAPAAEGDERMWTARVRRRALAAAAARQAAARPAARLRGLLGVRVRGGHAGGARAGDRSRLRHCDRRSRLVAHNPVGHFFNSVHLWSVELFMAFMVIHLWGKFWMAAWRGRRAMTWITGVVAFAASVVECFTGYLSQQNFDSQWIATNGKDAFNAVGVGAFFNVMNFGQMLLWHVVLIPIVLIALVGAHVLLVRVRGVSHPLPAQRSGGGPGRRKAAGPAADAAPWRGPTRRYDMLKEATIAGGGRAALTLGLAGVLSSPDVPPVTVQTWAKAGPGRLRRHRGHRTERHRRDRHLRAAVQQRHRQPCSRCGSVNWQKLAGVTQPVNAAQDFVLGPLAHHGPDQPRAGRGTGHLHGRPGRPAAEVGHRLRATRSPRCSSSAARRWSRPPPTGRSRS